MQEVPADNTLQQQLDNVNAVVHQLQQQLQETQQQLQQTQQQLQQTQQQLQQAQQQLQQGHQQINQLLQQPVQQSSSNEDGSVPATVTTAVGLRQHVAIHRNMVRRAQRMRNRLRALVRHPRVRRLPDEEDE